MALLPVPHLAGLAAVVAAGAVVGCGPSTTRLVVDRPRIAAEPGRKLGVVVLAVPPAEGEPSGTWAEQLRERLVVRFVAADAFEVVGERTGPSSPSERDAWWAPAERWELLASHRGGGSGPPWEDWFAPARRYAAGRGADVVAVVHLGLLAIETGRHHVREYHDGSASARTAIVDVATGAVLADATERAHLSARSRYASREEVRDRLLERLAGALAGSMLYERVGWVALVEGDDGALRPGIDLARDGEWSRAAAAWRPLASAGDPAAHYDLAVACAVLGRTDEARTHLETAARLAPADALYRAALDRARLGRPLWEDQP